MTKGRVPRRIPVIVWLAGVLLVAGVAGSPSAARAQISTVPALNASSHPRTAIPVAVFGDDSRKPLPRRLRSLQRSIGLIYNNKARSVCTGFCIADNIVATASHCLFRTAGERRPRLGDFRFVLRALNNQPSTPIAGSHYRSPAQFVVAGSRNLRVEPPIDATRDWALVRLAKPLCRGGVLPVARPNQQQKADIHKQDGLLQVSFHHDFADWRLAFSGPCSTLPIDGEMKRKRIERDFTDPDALLLHTCDTGGASSGSPLLIRGPDQRLTVVAINVGTYVQTRMLLDRGKVVRRYKSDSIANTAVSVTAFIPAMDVFSRARILERPDKIRALQAGLKSQGLYGGQIDGTFGPETRQAIQAFVGNPASEAAGLPTADLLATVTSLKPNRGGTDDQTAETKARSQTLSGGRLQRRIMPAARRPREESPTAPVRRP
jgi:hypothetical protein